MIAMNALRERGESLGLSEVRTLLQSGNLTFKSTGVAAKLEKRFEAATKKRFDREVAFMVRSATEWKTLITANPFPSEAEKDPSHLVVLCLKDIPTVGALEALKKAIVGREYLEARGRELYLVYPDGIGNSKLTNAVIDRRLGTIGTGRNWNTVRKIAIL